MNSSCESKSFTSGYPLTTFSIRPFNDYDLTGNPTEAAQRKAWNRQLSSVRIFVEHAFGHLKGRFPYLCFMPGRNMTEMYRIIEALMIVHNILEEYGDDPTTIAGFNGQEDEEATGMQRNAAPHNGQDGGSDELHQQGLLRRKILLDYFINYYQHDN